MYYAGIDVGSVNTKAVIVDAAGAIVGSCVTPSGVGLLSASRRVFDEALAAANLEANDAVTVVSTGYGRDIVANRTKALTEITCHARGAFALFPNTRTVIDIGGQDSKVIALSETGAVTSFEMNDKCAAGTGRFLEVMARALEVGLDRMGAVALESHRAARISSTCTVFAETEVVSLLAQGVAAPEIVAGLCNAVAERVHGLAARVGVRSEITMTGGVSRNLGVVRAMERILGIDANVPGDPVMVGALGAALIARGLAENKQR